MNKQLEGLRLAISHEERDTFHLYNDARGDITYGMRKGGIFALALAVLPSVGPVQAATESTPAAGCPSTAYVTNSFSQTVSAIDTTTLEVVDKIKVGSGPSVVTICHSH